MADCDVYTHQDSQVADAKLGNSENVYITTAHTGCRCKLAFLSPSTEFRRLHFSGSYMYLRLIFYPCACPCVRILGDHV